MVPGTIKSPKQKCDRCGLNSEMVHSPVTLSSLEEKFTEEMYFNAICESCSAELEGLLHRASDFSVDTPGDKLIEGVHYYMENDLMVFTELYHVAKGYCCKSGCRHCAYGYKIEI